MNGTHSPELHSISSRLRSIQRRDALAAVLRWTILSVASYLLAVVLALALEYFLRTGTQVRTVMFWLIHTGIPILLATKVLPPLLVLCGLREGESDHETARRVGDRFPVIKDHLLNAMQLVADESNRQRYSGGLIDSAFADVLRRAGPVDFQLVTDFLPVRRAGMVGGIGALITLLLFLVFPGEISGSLERLWNHDRSFDAPAPFRLSIAPGNGEVVKGDPVTITVNVDGVLREPLKLMARPERQVEFENLPLQSVSDTLFRHEIPSLSVSTSYYAFSGEIRTEEHLLAVLDRPIVKLLRLTVQPPAYSGLARYQAGDHVGDLSALKGTKIHFEVESSKPLSHAHLVFDDGTEHPLSVEENMCAGDLRLTKSQGYHVRLKDISGLENKDPVHYAINLVPDRSPVVRIETPGVDMDVAGNERLQMVFAVADDYGVGRLRLAYRLTQSRYEPPAVSDSYIEIPLPQATGTNGFVQHVWPLEALSLVPEDVIIYHAEVFDRDNVSGPNVGRSESYTLRLPSIEEVFASIDEKHETGIEMLKDLLKEVNEARSETGKLEEEIRRNQQQPDWNNQKKAEDLAAQYEEVQKKIEEAASLVDQMTSEMEKNRVVSPETLEKYRELQQLFEQLDSDELREAMQRLQESMREMTPDEIMNAMEQLKMTEEQIRASIERTMNLLKRIQIEQKVDEAIRRIEEMVEEQKEVHEATDRMKESGQQNDAAETARRQEELAEKMDQLRKQLDALKEMMEQFPADMPLSELDKAMAQMDSSAIADMMKAISEQMQSMQMSQASSAQQQTMMSMEQLRQQLMAMQNALQQNMQQAVLNEFRKVYQDLLELSRREEEMKNETGGLQRNSPRFREGISEQMEAMKDLGNIADRLAEVAQKSFGVTPEMGKSIGEAMEQMSGAMESLEQRNGQNAASMQEGAMASLNEAAQQVQAGMNAMMQQQGGQGMGMPGLMQQLQGMTALQQGINQGTRHLGGMGQRQAAEMSRLAGEQGGVRKALEQLAREASQAGELSKLLGDLSKAAKEMREVQTDLARGEVRPETIQKQDRILSRLLDSQRSMRERDFEQRRTSTTASGYRRETQPESTLGLQQARDRLRQDLLKAMEQGYSKDYQAIIRSYFELLEQDTSHE